METERPNILWFCTDQQRFDTIGALGNPHVHTPNLNRLAESGTAFTRAYCQNPICTPSRASFMTGRYPSAVGVNTNGNDFFPLDAEETLVSRLFAEAGYDCGLVGKLHLAGCADRKEPRVSDGFRVFEWSHSPRPLWSANDHCYARWLIDKGLDPQDVLHLRDKRKDRAIVPSPDQDNVVPAHHHLTWAGERAAHFVRTARRPWLLCLNTFEPHPPFNPPWEYFRRYDPASLPGPLFRKQDIEHQRKLEAAGVDFQTTSTDPSEFGGKALQAAYYASVEFVDHQLGLLLQTLQESGQLDNTIVLFMSDHGEMLGDHGLVQKGCRFYDGLVRVPLIWSWPAAIRRGITAHALTELTDVAPTLLELAGIAAPGRMQGRSLAGILTGLTDPDSHRDSVRSEYLDSLGMSNRTRATMYRDDTWKLVQYHSAGTGELYNMNDDPGEFTNLWDDPSVQRVREELIRRNADRTVLALDAGIRATRSY